MFLFKLRKRYAGAEFENTQQSSAILDLYLRETRSGKLEGYRDYMVFERSFQNVFCPHENEKSAFSNSPGLMTVTS